MSPTRYPVGKTLRGFNGNGPDNRLRHAWTPSKASRTGSNVRARCGASILPNPYGDLFDPDHPRACRRCIRVVRDRG